MADRGVRTQVVTILFCDLVASTERRARMGDDDFDEFNARFISAIRDTLTEHDGYEASNAGDGVMAVFPRSAADAVSCATQLHSVIAELDPIPPKLRIGISSGEVAVEGDEADGAAEYHGMPIVEAARLEAKASPGQTLASAVVRTLVGSRRSLHFRDVGALELKGIPAPLPTVEVIEGPEVADVDGGAPGSGKGAAKAPSQGDPRRRRVLVIAAAVVVVALIAAVVTVLATRNSGSGNVATQGELTGKGITKPRGYTPQYEPTPCPPNVTQVASDATCGYLIVPETRSKPNGRKVTLLVTRAPARNPGGQATPTIDLCGCEDLGNSIARDHAELIQMPNRGFGASQPTLDCPEVNAVTRAGLAKPSTDAAQLADEQHALAVCHDRLVGEGVDLGAYQFDAVALDAMDLMYALHIQRADFTASELVAAAVFGLLRRAPAAVRSISLENGAPPGQTALTDSISDMGRSFDAYVKLCQQDPTCVQSYPDLAAKWKSAVASANASPAGPLSVEDPEDASRPPVSVLVDGPRLVDALHAGLMDSTAYPLIPAAITAPTVDPVVASQVLANEYFLWSPAAHWGTLASYLCAYDVHTMNTGAMEIGRARAPQFVQSVPLKWPEWCKSWKVPDISERLSADVVSSVPTFIFRGQIDPDGNDAWVDQLRRGLSQSQAVLFPTLGANLLTSGPPCLSDLRRQFLANPTRHLETVACAGQSQPIKWVGSN